MASNPFSNIYIQQAVRSVVSNLTGSYAAGSIGSNISNSLLNGGISSRQLGGVVASGISFVGSEVGLGSSSFIPGNVLANRNFSVSNITNPETSVSNSKDSTTGGQTLNYPTDQAPLFLSLNFYKYSRKAPLANSHQQIVGTVNLPLPDGQGLVDNTTVAWTAQNLGIVGNILDELQRTGMLKLGAGGGIDFSERKNEKAIGDILARGGSEFAKRAGLGDVVAGYEAAAGVAANPSLSMLFNGIRDFRRFTFSWTFSPKTEPESQKIRDIIRYLKARQLPTLSGSGGNSSGSSLYFNYPDIVKPAFSFGGDYLTDFKFCVVHSINVNYSPQGVAPTFFKKTNAPTIIQLTMELQEMEYRLSEDYDSSAVGKDVNGNLIGQGMQTLKNAVGNTVVKSIIG